MGQQGKVGKSEPKLTPKQAKFVKALAEGKNQTQAALEAYPAQTYQSARVQAVENLAKPNIREAIEHAIGFHKITPEEAVAPVRMALDYKGETDRDTVDVRLKGLHAYLKLSQFIDNDGEKGGNTFIINNEKSQQFFKK